MLPTATRPKIHTKKDFPLNFLKELDTHKASFVFQDFKLGGNLPFKPESFRFTDIFFAKFTYVSSQNVLKVWNRASASAKHPQNWTSKDPTMSLINHYTMNWRKPEYSFWQTSFRHSKSSRLYRYLSTKSTQNAILHGKPVRIPMNQLQPSTLLRETPGGPTEQTPWSCVSGGPVVVNFFYRFLWSFKSLQKSKDLELKEHTMGVIITPHNQLNKTQLSLWQPQRE